MERGKAVGRWNGQPREGGRAPLWGHEQRTGRVPIGAVWGDAGSRGAPTFEGPVLPWQGSWPHVPQGASHRDTMGTPPHGHKAKGSTSGRSLGRTGCVQGHKTMGAEWPPWSGHVGQRRPQRERQNRAEWSRVLP